MVLRDLGIALSLFRITPLISLIYFFLFRVLDMNVGTPDLRGREKEGMNALVCYDLGHLKAPVTGAVPWLGSKAAQATVTQRRNRTNLSGLEFDHCYQ